MDCRNLVIVSDLHCGCRLGLCPPDGIQLDDGGEYRPSAFQKKTWAWWKEFWNEFVPRACKREKIAVVVNGDLVDGVHHGATTQISHNIGDQAEMAYKILKPIADKAAYFYVVRGTEAHDGSSGREAESLAKRLGAVPNQEGQHARYDLWIRVGGALVNCMHHIGFTSSAAHEASAVNAEMSAIYNEAGRWHEEPPDYVVRSHRHRHIAVTLQGARGICSSVVTPGWQGKTPFAWKCAGARISQPQFGGIVIRHGDEEHFFRAFVRSIARGKVE